MTETDKRSRVSNNVKLYAFDRLVIGYCLLMVLLLVLLGRPLSQYIDELLFYASMAAVAAIVIRFVDEDSGRLGKFVRLLYPAMMFTFFYRATGGTMFLLFDNFYDYQLVALEKSVLTVYPTIYIDRHLLNVWTTELLSFCYSSYYLMIPVFLLTLFVKRDYEVIKSFTAACCLTFFLSYVLFFVYPIEGPRWYFAANYINDLEGPLFRQLTEFVIDAGAVHGGCMPSSHFGVALVILMYTFKHYTRAAWPLLILVAGLAAGTVWGRFHYVSDVVVGGLIGLVAVLLVWKYQTVSPGGGYKGSKAKEYTTENVS